MAGPATGESRRFVAACVQMRAGADKAVNVETALAGIDEAARLGARLVVLPEVFAWRGPMADDAREAESLAGETLARVADRARRHALIVVAGSILERDESAALPFNTSTVIDQHGERIAVYRKIHLFDVSIPGRVDVRESERRGRGRELTCVSTSLARLGLSVCYDLRFPELYRALARDGAEILCVPSAFTAHTGEAHWEVLLRARAIENQCFVLAPNQVGLSGHGHADYGNSMIIDPWGRILARAKEEDRVICAEIDPGELSRIRSELPCLQHIRLGR